MSAASVLQIARTQIGTVEKPAGSNHTKYGLAYGMDGVAWCAMFTWWCFGQAGDAPLVPKSAYTPTVAGWFQARGQWGSAPRQGALVFFDFPGDGVERISHIGIVEAVNADGTITTIEGNTTSGTSGSQRDGGGVWRRIRRAGIVGYGYPAYPRSRATLQRGSTGEDVKALQRALGVPVDGDFGPATEAALERFQQRRGLVVDGVCGPATWVKIGMAG